MSFWANQKLTEAINHSKLPMLRKSISWLTGKWLGMLIELIEVFAFGGIDIELFVNTGGIWFALNSIVWQKKTEENSAIIDKENYWKNTQQYSPLQFVDQRCASQPLTGAMHTLIEDSKEAIVELPMDYFECTISFVSLAHTFAPVVVKSQFSLLFLALVRHHNVRHMDFQFVDLATVAASPCVTSPYTHYQHVMFAHRFHSHSNFSWPTMRSLDLCTRRIHIPLVFHSLDQTQA